MAASTTKGIENGIKIIKLNETLSQNNNNSSESFKFSYFDLTVVILSVLSIIADLCTDLILIVEYYNSGYKSWALATFVLIFFPSLIVQAFSLRWHIVDKTSTVIHWLLHLCMLGILHRYILIIKAGIKARKTKSENDFEKLYFEQSDICILHLFESFLESGPQLVLQLYVIVVLREWRFWTALSAVASLFSLGWSLAAYTRAQRRARVDKHKTSWPGLILQAAWRIGMLTARITTLVLFAYCFRSWIFLFIGIHWVIMTVWIIHQKTDFCETPWEERIYNAVAGVIYCFCFFNLQEGQSRWRALTFYLIIVFQNLTCLTVFLMWFAEGTPKLALTAFIAVVGGTLIGVASMLLYYRFFHPSGPIKFFLTPSEPPSHHDTSQSHSTGTLRSLKNIRHEVTPNTSQENSPQSDTKQLLNNCRSPLSVSDSIVIIEENVMDDNDVDIKILQSWIDEEKQKNNVKETEKNPPEGGQEDESYKRRAICSSADLVKLIDEEESTTSLKLVPTDEAPSEILSAHDYENLAAVNIARETWGLRSWRGYSDIETWLHDDSVVHDRRRDTLTSTTTSSERSSNLLEKENERTRQDDYLDTIADDLAQCESETSSEGFHGHFSIDSLGGIYPVSTLDTILEELEESSISTTDLKTRRQGSASTLVATIDEIRLNTPEKLWREEPPHPINGELAPEEVIFLSKLKTVPEVCDKVATILQMENQQHLQEATPSPPPPPPPMEPEKNLTQTFKKNKNRPRRKFSLIREKFETKRSESTTDLFTSNESINSIPSEPSAKFNTDVVNKENIPTVASKISHWDTILNSQNVKKTPEKTKTIISPSKKVSVKEKRNLFLKQVLTPPKFQSLKKKQFKMSP